jgi:hypothetical protein
MRDVDAALDAGAASGMRHWYSGWLGSTPVSAIARRRSFEPVVIAHASSAWISARATPL